MLAETDIARFTIDWVVPAEGRGQGRCQADSRIKNRLGQLMRDDAVEVVEKKSIRSAAERTGTGKVRNHSIRSHEGRGGSAIGEGVVVAAEAARRARRRPVGCYQGHAGREEEHEQRAV